MKHRPSICNENKHQIVTGQRLTRYGILWWHFSDLRTEVLRIQNSTIEEHPWKPLNEDDSLPWSSVLETWWHKLHLRAETKQKTFDGIEFWFFSTTQWWLFWGKVLFYTPAWRKYNLFSFLYIFCRIFWGFTDISIKNWGKCTRHLFGRILL